MELILYPLLCKCSKRAIKRKAKRFGHPYRYIPKRSLIDRLSSQLGMSESQIREQLAEERKFLLEYAKYYP